MAERGRDILTLGLISGAMSKIDPEWLRSILVKSHRHLEPASYEALLDGVVVLLAIRKVLDENNAA